MNIVPKMTEIFNAATQDYESGIITELTYIEVLNGLIEQIGEVVEHCDENGVDFPEKLGELAEMVQAGALSP